MDVCGLSKARPIVCYDFPAFQRSHTSIRCATESRTYFPWRHRQHLETKVYLRCLYIDLLNAPGKSNKSTSRTAQCDGVGRQRREIGGEVLVEQRAGPFFSQ